MIGRLCPRAADRTRLARSSVNVQTSDITWPATSSGRSGDAQWAQSVGFGTGTLRVPLAAPPIVRSLENSLEAPFREPLCRGFGGSCPPRSRVDRPSYPTGSADGRSSSASSASRRHCGTRARGDAVSGTSSATKGRARVVGKRGFSHSSQSSYSPMRRQARQSNRCLPWGTAALLRAGITQLTLLALPSRDTLHDVRHDGDDEIRLVDVDVVAALFCHHDAQAGAVTVQH